MGDPDSLGDLTCSPGVITEEQSRRATLCAFRAIRQRREKNLVHVKKFDNFPRRSHGFDFEQLWLGVHGARHLPTSEGQIFLVSQLILNLQTRASSPVFKLSDAAFRIRKGAEKGI